MKALNKSCGCNYCSCYPMKVLGWKICSRFIAQGSGLMWFHKFGTFESEERQIWNWHCKHEHIKTMHCPWFQFSKTTFLPPTSSVLISILQQLIQRRCLLLLLLLCVIVFVTFWDLFVKEKIVSFFNTSLLCCTTNGFSNIVIAFWVAAVASKVANMVFSFNIVSGFLAWNCE